MSRYSRHNPDEPISHEWLAGERRVDELRELERRLELEIAERREALSEHLRDMRRDAAAEAALALPGLESTGVETISPADEPLAGTKPTKQDKTK